MGRALAAIEAQVDVIISSPLKRATQTASLVGNEMGYEGKLQIETALRPGATFADFRRLLEKYASQESIMVVGHNPSLSHFLGTVISESGCEASVDLKKGAVARVDMRRSSGTLQWCLTPKSVTHSLHRRSGEFAPENFAEVSAVLFRSPTVPGPRPCAGAARASDVSSAVLA